jgi:hypothetical protein
VSEKDEGGLLNYFKKLLTPTPPTTLDRFDFYETQWQRRAEDRMGYRWSMFNDEWGYRIAVHSKGESRPEEYVVKLMPYEIAYYEDPGDVTIPSKYEYGNDEAMYFEYFGDMISPVGSNDEIAYIADDDEVKILEYDFGDSEIEQTVETEWEAKDFAGMIMETMENGDWDSHRPALSNLPPEYRQPSY